jgi:RHS repeat-associated protein
LIASSGTYKDYNDYLFSTKRYERQWGLNYYGYRFYSADLGRWLNRDPIGESGGLNLYGFVGNRVINNIDSVGLDGKAYRFWGLSDKQINAWFEMFKEIYWEYIEKSSRSHTIPRELLAAMVANELIDYDIKDVAADVTGLKGASYGPSQIKVKTVKEEGLTVSTLSDKEIRDELLDARRNIFYAGGLIRKYLNRLCKDAKEKKLSRSFLRTVAIGCETKDFCCKKASLSPDKVVNMNVPTCLIGGMAAIWNQGYEVTKMTSIPTDAPYTYNHANNAWAIGDRLGPDAWKQFNLSSAHKPLEIKQKLPATNGLR